MNKKIDCVERLLEINNSYQEICDWLLLSKYVDEVTVREKTRKRERAEFIYETLKKKEKDGLIMLLYFEWTLLPNESIKITVVTENEEKLFTYGI